MDHSINRHAVRKVSLHEKSSDADFWRSRPPEERLQALESIRCEYHGWSENEAQNDARPRLQRVCRVLKRA